MNGLAKSTVKTTKQLAQDAAKKAAREPFEVLKVGQQQIASEINSVPSGETDSSENSPAEKQSPIPNRQEVQAQDQQRIKELEQQLKGISKDKLLKELQEKITRGETVYLESYPQLSMDEKQVLKAQEQAVKVRRQQEAEADTSLPQPASKPSRKLGAAVKGMKGKVEQIKRKTEIRLPPSG